MEVDHLINQNKVETFDWLKNSCVYCSETLDFDKWKHLCEGWICYKLNNCKSCGRTNHINVPAGSGHDAWTGIRKTLKKPSAKNTIEEKV